LTEEDLKWGPTFAQENNLIYLEVSCKTGENINYCLYKLFSRIAAPEQPASGTQLLLFLSIYMWQYFINNYLNSCKRVGVFEWIFAQSARE